MFARTKGLALAMATLFVNAMGLALALDRDPTECGGLCSDAMSHLSLFITFIEIGVVPCALAGIFIGWVAGTCAHAPRASRWLVLAGLASFVVLVLGAASQLLSFTIVSAIPTLAAVAALERWTRAPRENALARAKVISAP